MIRNNCPNCGAPIRGPVCLYCDTILKESESVTLYADNIPIVRLIEQEYTKKLYKDVINSMYKYKEDKE